MLQSSLRRETKKNWLGTRGKGLNGLKKEQTSYGSMKSLISSQKNISLPHLDEDWTYGHCKLGNRSITSCQFSGFEATVVSCVWDKGNLKAEWIVESVQIHATKTCLVRRRRSQGHEVKKIDEALKVWPFINPADINIVQIVLKQLQRVESSIRHQELEEGLELIFRCLLNTWVALFNILNHWVFWQCSW